MDESILFFSKVSLSKFSLEALYNMWVSEVFILVCIWNAKGQFFLNRVVWRLGLVTWLSSEFKPRANCLASLGLLSCSAATGVTFRLLCMLHMCASFGDLPTASQSRDPVVSPCRMHTSELLFTLSHTLPLHDSHINIGFLNAELQANLVRNKANKMVD